MSHDYDDDFERGAERRSRRNPKLRETEGGATQPGGGSQDFTQAEDRALKRSEKEKWESRHRQAYMDADDELDVLGDPSVHPVRPQSQSAVYQDDERPGAAGQSGNRRGTAGQAGNRRGTAGQAGSRHGAAGQTGNRRVDERGSAARQTAAAGGGLSPRLEAQIAKKKKRRRMIAMIVAECLALIFIFGYGFVARTMAKMQRPQDFKIAEIPTNEISVDAVETMKGYWTIAIFGVDSRDNAIQKSTNADVNMICNINLDTGEIRLVSVYRDSYLNVSDNGTYNKINQAYFLGGAKQAVAALNRNLDLKINDFVTFNWKGVAQAIDILGGVDVELSKTEFYYINSFITETVKVTGIGSHQLKHAGMNHLDGVQAVAYGRLRLMDSDYARTERQRKIISLAFEKAQKADFQTLYTMLGTVFPNVYTTLWIDDLVNNARNISKFHLGETTGFPNQRGEANMVKKGSVVVPATLESNVIRLHEFLFDDESYTPSDTVMQISRKIAQDTGVTKENQVIDKVGTSGGVIQPPKTKPAETESKNNSDDEDGDYVEIETDEDGFRVPETIKSTSPTRPTTEAETDEFGDAIETTSHASRPGDPLESGTGTHPTRPGATTPTRPGESSGTNPTVTDRPGTVTDPTSSTSGSTGRPGTVTDPTSSTSGSTGRPGTVVEPTSGSTGGVTGAPGSTTTEPTASTGPGSGTTAAEIPQFPGGNDSETIQQGPGGQDAVNNTPGGTVSAPGM